MSLTDEERVALDQLLAQLQAIAAAEGGEMLEGVPRRWLTRDPIMYRCTQGHVSNWRIKSEALGRSACIAGSCRAPLAITFPEDVDGPLAVPVP